MPPLSDGSLAPFVTGDVDDARAFRMRIERVQSHDMAALGELFIAYGDLVYRAAYRLTGSRADAEDVTQELFIRLPGAVRGFTGAASSFPGWIRQVAVRQALMLLRGGRRRREVSVEGLAALMAPADRSLDRMTLETALERLSDDHRMVFLLK